MACSLFPCIPHPSVVALVVAALLALGHAAAQDMAEGQEDREFLPQDETFFAPVLRDIERALAGIADVPAMTSTILEGGSPHLVLFLEGKEHGEGREHPVVQTMRALADNHQLGLEYQSAVLSDGSPLFGFLLFQPFPTLEMAWETHPYESVASEQGAWLQPFADLSDVESVHSADGRATLVFSDAAARRIDTLSDLHGHRSYRVRGAEMAGASDLGSYTWVPGLGSIPGVPAIFTCRLPRRNGQWKDGVTLDYLRQRFTVHAAAREQIRRELDLSDAVSWTIAAAPPRYAEPFFAWMVHAPEAGGRATQLPWFRADAEKTRRWLHVQVPTATSSNAIIPRHWTFSRSGENASLLPRPATGPEAAAQEEAFASFMRQNIGGEMAIVMQGQVAGVLAIDAARPEVLAFSSMPPSASAAMERLWNAANAGTGTAIPAAALAQRIPAAPLSPPDTFQVRLMAEPQDREYVAVTHFSAPGSAAGTVVAVLNDIILDGRSVTGAHLEKKEDKLFLRLTFTPEAQEALGGACFGNMGKQLAILYNDRLLCAPTIVDWEIEDLSFKGMDSDWPDVARALAEHLAAKG